MRTTSSRIAVLLLGGLLLNIAAYAQVELHVLGIAQDAGRPQLGCTKACCLERGKPRPRIPVVSLGITQADPSKSVLIEATPDIASQWGYLTTQNKGVEPSTIFVTHAHMGHYTGLLQLGREARNANGVSVFGHPTFIDFIATNQPWKQLVTLRNIIPVPMNSGQVVEIGQVSIQALQVPHRDEISATYAYLIKGPSKTALFLPDIDKWEKWTLSIDSLVKKVDFAFLDATFFSSAELPGRNMSEIPHPLVEETLERSKNWSSETRQKIILTHFNHTNPLIQDESLISRTILSLGLRISRVGDRFVL
jgi:pyrroloquinoline quinone biosynthesis protein B